MVGRALERPSLPSQLLGGFAEPRYWEQQNISLERTNSRRLLLNRPLNLPVRAFNGGIIKDQCNDINFRMFKHEKVVTLPRSHKRSSHGVSPVSAGAKLPRRRALPCYRRHPKYSPEIIDFFSYIVMRVITLPVSVTCSKLSLVDAFKKHHVKLSRAECNHARQYSAYPCYFYCAWY